MKILFWVPYPSEGASNRYRVEQYLPFLEAEGIKYSLRPFWSKSAFKILYKKEFFIKKCCYFILGTLWRFWDLLSIRAYDCVFIHREAFPLGGAFLERLLLILHKPFIFDFDDAIFITSTSQSNIFMRRLRDPNRISDILKMSKHVIAGNNHLKNFAKQFSDHITVIPTPIDTSKYSSSVQKEGERVTIGWIGSITTLEFLRERATTFIELTRIYPDILFKFVGVDLKIEGLNNVESKEWDHSREIADLESFDIGIMPMPDNQWTRGKCGFKAISYMSMGIPCVCSPVGINKEIITDGVNGFLAETKQGWIEKLSLLINNPQLRKKIGLAGRKTIEEGYSVRIWAPKFISVIKGIPK